MLRYLTSGESHGKSLVAIIDGLPAGIVLDEKKINCDLARRMLGYGRGKRMRIEADKVEVLSGIRKGRTIGSPIAIMLSNVDRSIDRLPDVFKPRPGHADLSGVLKYDLHDVRDCLERASARETAARVGIGAICKTMLSQFDIRVASHVTMIGGVRSEPKGLGFSQIVTVSEKSPVRCADPRAGKQMCAIIENAMKAGDTLGGIFEIIVQGVPPGLGSYTQWDKRLDGILAQALLSIQAVKGVEFGIGFESARRKGSLVHDEIFYDKKKGFYRKTNNAGGIEGGMTNGEDIVIHAVMKPISTLRAPLASVDLKTKKPVLASVERSDVCAVPAAGVIGESVVAIAIAGAMIEKFGGDSISEMKRNFAGYLRQVRKA